jgi:membrane associated rhomboid family serine protease
MSAFFRRWRPLACAVGGCCAVLSAPAACDVLPRASPPFPIFVASGLEGAAVATAAVMVNTGVYLAWLLPAARVRGAMERWFVSWAGSIEGGRAASPRNVARALLSSVSHRSLLHLGCNMAGVVSFTPAVIDGAETAARPKLAPAEYAALWAASGTASALASSAFSARFGSGTGGLGASGFLFSILSFHALCNPDARILLFFVLECTIRDGLGLATAANVYLVLKEVLASRGLGASPTPTLTRSPPTFYPSLAGVHFAEPPPPFRPLARCAGKPPRVDGMAHLVGTAIGAAAFWLARERAKRRRRGRKARPASTAVTIQRPPGNSARV